MALSQDLSYAFDVEWDDLVSGVVWKYRLNYYPETEEIEMVDLKNRRAFLKRCMVKSTNIVPELLRPGAMVTVLARQLIVVDFADEATRMLLGPKQERTLALIKPDAIVHMGSIIDQIIGAGFLIGELRMCRLSLKDSEGFYAVHNLQPFFARLTNFMSSGKIVALELLGDGAVAKWRELLGPTDSDEARLRAPQSLRARFGQNKTHNACHGSDAAHTARQECDFFFGPRRRMTCWQKTSNSSLCLVKPHAAVSPSLGKIIGRLQAGFTIAAMQTCHLSMSSAAELLELYKIIKPPGEFSSTLEELSSGPSIAIEVCSLDNYESVEALRQLCGPADPMLARAAYKTSLRALFGESQARNAVHCTDLEEDAARELCIAFQQG